MIEPTALIGSSAVPVTVDDRLRVVLQHDVTSSATAVIYALLLTENNGLVRLSDAITIPSGAGQIEKEIQLTSGLLITASIDVNGTNVTPGQCYAQLQVHRTALSGNVNLLKLTSGYISDGDFLSFPYTSSNSTSSQASPATAQSGSNPPAGSEISETIGTGGQTTLLGWTFNLITDATVANRRVTVLIQGNAFGSYRIKARTDQPASTTRVYRSWYGPNIPDDDLTNNVFFMPVPEALSGLAMTFDTETANLQAGDDFDNALLTYSQQIVI